ncbi:hypothetical protein RHODO2019_18085 (plasmid) [Rhodococcus antarcticus]|uniref:Uncharacterized protein n=1 Tax=Rhodococcus antarcticus TaxID=2987751 RepID=A0ABY6P714_9NOCA|nr:hypothetical protein [Rhodococcus antarcticus]UZJ26903.1 hypothetical protein RHODO2019_18085 [Rhodococcus antarcticus]
MPDPMASPSPALMPKRTAIIPPAARPPGPPHPALYAVDPTISRRGDPQYVAWPDTGVLLSIHASPNPPDSHDDYDMPTKFRAHYRKRTRLAPRITREIRGLAFGSGTSARDFRVSSAASTAYTKLLLGDDALSPVELTTEDAKQVEKVQAQLRALPGADQSPHKHGGEAEIIVLAAKAAAGGGRHVILANDVGASVVANAHGLSSRHAADVIAELSCSDPTLDPNTCLRRFRLGNDVSGIPAACAPTDTTPFQCVSGGSTCALCP